MTFRLSAFSKVGVEEPTLFLDSDMICLAPFDPERLLNGAPVAVCGRDFDRNRFFKFQTKQMNMMEHAGKTVAEVYPYLACATLVKNVHFWADCHAECLKLHPQYHNWYGDQEAIRNVISKGRYQFSEIRESIYACLPEQRLPNVKLLHFKGAARKPAMLDYAKRFGLL